MYKRQLHRDWKQVQQDLEHLVALAEKNKADEDYIRFQLEQVEEMCIRDSVNTVPALFLPSILITTARKYASIPRRTGVSLRLI